MAAKKTAAITEFGDFQTPDALALQVLHRLRALGVRPATVIEPTCGQGAFVAAAGETFPDAGLVGLDINDVYIAFCAERMKSRKNVSLSVGDFFEQDWKTHLSGQRAPLLVTGNPPWVTNAELGALGSSNLPVKSNFQKHKGLDAVTGKANFDISEWMLLRNLEWLEQTGGTLAVLVKTAVARKILAHAWKNDLPVQEARMYRIDALGSFGAAVEACLFYVDLKPGAGNRECLVFDSLESETPAATFGFSDGKIIFDMNAYRRHYHLHGINPTFTWRSGVKHDCARVMEFSREGGVLRNGYGEAVDIEGTCLFPLIKSSDINGVKKLKREKLVLVTQKYVGQETHTLETIAPRTWKYLMDHAEALDRRSSIIYRNKPRFSMFGIGDYTFAPWKIAISGLYKSLTFKLFPSRDGKPVCFDDTVYFLPFNTEEDAKKVLTLLQKPEAREFLEAMIFWDEKRPITVDVLKRLDIAKLLSTVDFEVSSPISNAAQACQVA